jgi:electron transfer flavoprotein beta subunit
MRIVVPLKAVPDLVEEIEVTPDETGIDREYLTFVLSEWDAQALEEALLLKDAGGAEVEVVAVGLADDPDIDQLLYTALAKGAGSAVKLAGAAGNDGATGAAGAGLGPGPASAGTANRAALLAAYLAAQPADLVITGVQAIDDLDGQLAPLLAALLDVPHVSVVIGVEPVEREGAGGSVVVRQEFAGGRVHELEVQMPAVIGVQSARQTPRYAPITRIRQAMQAGGLSELRVPSEPIGPARSAGDGLVVRRVHGPEATGKAEMMTGGAGEVAERIVGLLRARGLVKGGTAP